jgi:hypothetical protein
MIGSRTKQEESDGQLGSRETESCALSSALPRVDWLDESNEDWGALLFIIMLHEKSGFPRPVA